MTREEFYEKYGDVVVKFSSYYKYTFTFEGTLLTGERICVGYGGCSDEIYRYELTNDEEVKISNLCPYKGEVYALNENGISIEVESFYDY